MIDAAAVAKVESHIADALEKGGRLVLGGKRHALGGSFFEPTIVAGVTRDMRVAREVLRLADAAACPVNGPASAQGVPCATV